MGNQCHDRKNSIRHIENRFSLYLKKCSLGFDEQWLLYHLQYTCLK